MKKEMALVAFYSLKMIPIYTLEYLASIQQQGGT